MDEIFLFPFSFYYLGELKGERDGEVTGDIQFCLVLKGLRESGLLQQREKQAGFSIKGTSSQISVTPLAICITLGKSLTCSEPQFSQLCSGGRVTTLRVRAINGDTV